MAIHLGQANVEYAHVGCLAPGAFQPLKRPQLNQHFIPQFFQQHGQHPGHVLVVVHQQDAQLAGRFHHRLTALGTVRFLAGFSHPRQRHHKSAPLVQAFAGAGNLTAVQVDQGFYQGQAQTQATLRPVGRAFSLGKKIKHPQLQFRRHANAIVLDDQGHVLFMNLGAQLNDATRWRELGGVVEQVGQNLHQPFLVHQDIDFFGRQVDHQPVVARLNKGLHLLHGIGDQRFYLMHAFVDTDQAAGHTRHVKQVIDQVGHVADLARDHTAHLFQTIVIQMGHADELGRRTDGCQRVPQLMGQHG